MIPYSELTNIENNILLEVDKYCRDNNITYFLAYGTLLGAVRHKGFIPWDDDIDIFMPRDDYNRFMKEFKHDSLTAFSCEQNSDYLYPFGKVSHNGTLLIESGKKQNYSALGVNIDVFPLDYLPNSKIKRGIRYLRGRLFRYVYISKTMTVGKERGMVKYMFSKISSALTKGKSTNELLRKWNSYMGYKKKETSRYMGCMVWGYGKREMMPKEVFLPTGLVEFNGVKYSAPNDAHQYLTKLYGDYMQLPPEEKRVTHHDFEVFYRQGITE